MRSAPRWLLITGLEIVALAFVMTAGCGGAKGHAAEAGDDQFACKGRAAGYVETIQAGGEAGIAMDCSESGPRIKRWRVDKGGNRQEDTHSIAGATFEKVWTQIDGTGWANLHDCPNGTLAKGDPVYAFAIHDDQNQTTFKCQTREMPYPYNDITDPLDLAANQGQKQLGDDEPADAKALDKDSKH